MSPLSQRPRFGLVATALLSCLFLSGPTAASSSKAPEDKSLRADIEKMKAAPRGPFARIRWFCKDGTVHPPKPYACKSRGGGVQHGEWTKRVKQLRGQGYYIANVLASADTRALAKDPMAVELSQILVERYLVAVDDGWVFRRALYYRGALQEEDERRGGRDVLVALLQNPKRVQKDYALVRAAARLLPHGAQTKSATLVRQLSADLSNRDKRFMSLRNKIHVQPGPEDAAAVRAYAAGKGSKKLRPEFERLAAAIDSLYADSDLAADLTKLAGRSTVPKAPADQLREAAAAFQSAGNERERYLVTGRLLGLMRDQLGSLKNAQARLAAIDVSLAVESTHFAAATQLDEAAKNLSRAQQIELLAAGADAVYGAGLIRERQHKSLAEAIATLTSGGPVNLDAYKNQLDYLKLVPAWSSQRMRFHFGSAVAKLSRLEPKAHLFIDDQLRGSPLFAYSHIVDRLVRDANSLAGVRNELFGDNVGAGLRALNPGLAKGILRKAGASVQELDQGGIYILPETTAELPPVAGILTAGEGNPLSHVQLLARNLGIPNVGVDEALLPKLAPMHDKPVILAVSAAGSVRLAEDKGESKELFKQRAKLEDQTLIRPNLEKLDLDKRAPIALRNLRADDSGRSVGPKAAKLGELKYLFPDSVADGVAIPFGVFRDVLDQPHAESGGSLFDWMKSEYRRLAELPDGSDERRAQTEAFRATLYDLIASTKVGKDLRDALKVSMEDALGPDGSYGVFVRSDTNVEDLPNFTGAGLNLTVPNVVGFDNIMEAIPRVWASPFTARAFAWRQAHMDQPEHVYPAVLLMRSVPAEKSGVLVTQEIDTGDRGWLSIAVNEGVGGAVDGQAAESIRIETASGNVRLLAQATAPIRKEVSLKGGVNKLPSQDRDFVLEKPEIEQLIELAKVLPDKFPDVVDGQGQVAPADIEFGFLEGKLQLFQIRPFLDSAKARGNAYLTGLDAGLEDLHTVSVNLEDVPR